MTSKFWIINLVLFQLAWFSCALLTPYASWIVPAIISLHLILSPSKKIDARILLAAVLGVMVDLLLMAFNIISFDTSHFPLWLVGLWAMFAISLNHSLAWLAKLKTWQVSLIGAIGGSTSYLAAIKFEAIITPFNTMEILLVYAFIWALLLPVMIAYQRKYVPI